MSKSMRDSFKSIFPHLNNEDLNKFFPGPKQTLKPPAPITKTVFLPESATSGGEIKIKNWEGNEIIVTVPVAFKSGQKLKLKGQGPYKQDLILILKFKENEV